MIGGFKEMFATVTGQSNRVLFFNKKVSVWIFFYDVIHIYQWQKQVLVVDVL